MNLQDIKWYDYHLYDLFIINTGNKFDKSKMTTFAPSVNFVGRSSKNNGVTAYVDLIDGVTPYPAGNMTIALGGEYIGSCFIQRHPFYTSQNVVVLSEIHPMSENVKLFIANLIRYESKNNYKAFARELNSHIKTDFVIKLPSISEGVVDFKFIEDYILKLNSDVSTIPDYFLNEGYDKACWYIDNIDQFDFESKYASALINQEISLSDRKWGEFRLGDEEYFNIERGDSEYIKNLPVGDVPYISTTSENNGISSYVLNANRKGNLITLAYDGSIGTCFYQENPFFASEKIVTIDTVQYKLNKYLAIFIIQILKLESELYSYGGRKWTVEKQLKNTIIKLPISDKGTPDYMFMENYIKSLPFSQKI